MGKLVLAVTLALCGVPLLSMSASAQRYGPEYGDTRRGGPEYGERGGPEYRERDYRSREGGYGDRERGYGNRDRDYGNREGGRGSRGREYGFDEREYLRCNPDVRQSIMRGQMASGAAHYQTFGMREGRRLSC